MTSRSFYAVGPWYALGHPHVPIKDQSLVLFVGLFFPVHSQKRLDIKRPHCSSCQDKIDQVLIWTGTLFRKHEKRPWHWSLWDPSPSTEQFPHPLHQSHQGKILQEASVHLRKCLSLAGLDMTLKRRRGRNFGLSFLTLFLLTRCSHYPLNTCARSHQFSETNKRFQTALSIWENPALWRERKTTESFDRLTSTHAMW